MAKASACLTEATPAVGRAITERYRCPQAFLEALTLAASSAPKIHELDRGHPGGERRFVPFDPTEAIDELRYERYGNVSALSPGMLLSGLYYAVRPLLPTTLRRRIQQFYLRDWKTIAFPRWPLDTTVEQLLDTALFALMEATGRETIPFIWFWPDGADSAAIVTHDIETATGRDFCDTVMDIDESFGIHSSFQVVPEGRYAVPPAFLETIRQRGHDVNIQDLNHDGRLFSSRARFETRVRRINQYGREFGARGFRSAVLYRNPDWFDELDFEYDMSLPNIGHLDAQRGGCCTVFPYFIGDLLEIPVTATQDYSLFHILHDYRLDLWRTQASEVSARNGLLSFIVHPDYLLESRARTTYCGLLEFLTRCRSECGTWMTTANELNTWWRLRSRMHLVEQEGTWRIEGPGSERAGVAFAAIKGRRISYFRGNKRP